MDTYNGVRSGLGAHNRWPTSPGTHKRGAAGRLHMGTSPTTEVHGYHRSAVLGLDNAFVFDYHAGTIFCRAS